MHQNFGARMRRRREEQGIAVASIAEQTKIKQSLLEALERDDVSHWPSGIFGRAYIRAYAQVIGLDPDVVVREFLEVHPEPVEEFEAALATALSTGVRDNASPPTRLRNIVGSALDSLSRFRRAPAVVQEVSHQPARPAHVEVDLPAGDEPDVHPPEIFGAVAVANDDPVADDCVAVADVEPVAAAPAPDESHRTITERTVAAPRVDLARLAEVCTAIGSLHDASDVQPVLNEAARLIEASGLIVWIWDDDADGLRPALACGYSPRVLTQLPTVKRHADNATAAAFRTATTCVMRGGPHSNGALAVPLMAPSGCIGVLALELPNGTEQEEPVRAVASILAAMIALWVSPLASAGEGWTEHEEAAEHRRTS
jgi:transcriptional regulator with XRE-family HTH domain